MQTNSGANRTLAIFLAAGLLSTAALAATPSSGTLSPTSTTLTYTAGPFDYDNDSAPAGGVTPTCAGDVLPCDQYALKVSIPPTDGTSYVATVSIGWADASSDFDMTILDANGNEVAQAASSADPEVASFSVIPRVDTDYTVLVVPYAVNHGAGGDTFTGTITLTVNSTPPPLPSPPPVPGVPRYQSYTPAPGSGLGSNAGEPSIGANWKSGNFMFQSDVQTLRVGVDRSCPSFAKSLWENKSSLTSQEDSDPILFTDPRTGRTWEGMLLLLTGRNEGAFSDDDGGLWIASQGSSITSGIDHETIGGGPFAPPLTRDPNGAVYPDAVYYCSQDIAAALCAVSADGGATFGPAVPIYELTDCGGLHGHVKVAPDGTAYVPNKNCNGPQAAVFSTDNGATWTVSTVPDSTGGDSDPSIGIGANGSIYFAYQASNGHSMIAVGHRTAAGISWFPSQDVGASFAIRNTAFPAVIAGDDDRAADAFLGTPAGGDFQSQSFRGIWHLYVAHTYDGGQTWTTVDATPDDPVQRGCIWLGGGAVTCRNLLDFNDATVDKEGRVAVGYADGCTGPCVDSPFSATGNAFTALASIALQSGGKRLFRQFDPAEPVAPGNPMVTATRDAAGVHVEWTEPDSGGSPITGYKVYRRADAAAQPTLLATTTAQKYLDRTATPGVKYFYSVATDNGVGESSACGLAASEVPLTDVVGTPCALPGVRVVADASGDQAGGPLANTDVDIESVSIAEPYDPSGAQNLVFTMKVADLSTLVPGRAWRIVWNYPVPPPIPNFPFDGIYYVGMNTDDSGAVSFEYGTVSLGTIGLVLANPVPNPIGPVEGRYFPDGTIRITVPRVQIGDPNPGDLLGGLYGRVFPYDSAEQTFRSTTALDSTPLATYGVVGNGACAPKVTTTCLEDDDARIAYSNGWHLESASGASAGHYRLHLGSKPNDGVSLSFQVPSGATGTLAYYYATSTKGGSAQLWIDGVARGTVSFAGPQGDVRNPRFGASLTFDGLAAGPHTFELRAISGPAYVDGFCLASASSSSQPSAGPGTTANGTGTLSAAQQLVNTVSLPANTTAVALAADASAPIKLVLMNSAGTVLASASNSSGPAVIEAPASPGTYLVQTVNLSAGPVSVWTATTPYVSR
ncbi:MAG TPA: fibronectin type III domain-containing protein [Thermoanaerobaculia bacterium]|nr:fibronectin type III domain-containing protein [Thermoanaerobaculia bacterium]